MPRTRHRPVGVGWQTPCGPPQFLSLLRRPCRHPRRIWSWNYSRIASCIGRWQVELVHVSMSACLGDIQVDEVKMSTWICPKMLMAWLWMNPTTEVATAVPHSSRDSPLPGMWLVKARVKRRLTHGLRVMIIIVVTDVCGRVCDRERTSARMGRVSGSQHTA